MGVFDFVRDVGAKIGIGKSTTERAADKAAEAASKASDALKKAREAKDKALDASKAAATKARQKMAAKERFSEYKKSVELEKYVSGLGLEAKNLDIRFDDGVAYITGEAADQATREKIILAVGNAEGVAKVDEELTVASEGQEAVFHTVKSGDTLWAIAQEVYGDGNRFTEIFEANKPMLTDPDLIYPGQVLRCPK